MSSSISVSEDKLWNRLQVYIAVLRCTFSICFIWFAVVGLTRALLARSLIVLWVHFSNFCAGFPMFGWVLMLSYWYVIPFKIWVQCKVACLIFRRSLLKKYKLNRLIRRLNVQVLYRSSNIAILSRCCLWIWGTVTMVTRPRRKTDSNPP